MVFNGKILRSEFLVGNHSGFMQHWIKDKRSSFGVLQKNKILFTQDWKLRVVMSMNSESKIYSHQKSFATLTAEIFAFKSEMCIEYCEFKFIFVSGIAFSNRFIRKSHKPSDKGSRTRAVPLNYQSMAEKRKKQNQRRTQLVCTFFCCLHKFHSKKSSRTSSTSRFGPHCIDSERLHSFIGNRYRLIHHFFRLRLFFLFRSSDVQVQKQEPDEKRRSRATRTAKCILISN